MIPYIILSLIPIIPFNQIKGSHKKINYIVFFVFFFLLLAFRGTDCGIDLSTYKYHFETINKLSLSEALLYRDSETLYVLLNWIVGRVGGWQWLLVIIGGFCSFSFYKLYSKIGNDSTIDCVLFLTASSFTMFFSGLRQTIAISIGVLCFLLITDKKNIRALLLIIVAFFFHKSAIVLLLLIPLRYMKFSKINLSFILFMMISCFVFREKIFVFVASVFNDYSNKYGGVSISQNGAFAMLVLYVLFLIYSFIISKKDTENVNLIYLKNIAILVVLIQMFASLNQLVMRFNYYFMIFTPLLISNAYKNSDNNYLKIAKVSKIIICTFMIMYFIYDGFFGSDDLSIFPYIPFWGGT